MVARSDDLSANENPNLIDGDDDSADDEESVGTAGCEPWKMALNCFLRSRFVLNFAPWIEYKECFLYWGRNRKIESLSTGGQIFSTSYVAITSFSELEWAWICAYMAHFCLGWQRIIQTTRSHCFLPKFVKFNMYNYSIIILYFFQKTSIAQKILNFLNRPNIPILKNRFF